MKGTVLIAPSVGASNPQGSGRKLLGAEFEGGLVDSVDGESACPERVAQGLTSLVECGLCQAFEVGIGHVIGPFCAATEP